MSGWWSLLRLKLWMLFRGRPMARRLARNAAETVERVWKECQE